jgi:hypothetical protein
MPEEGWRVAPGCWKRYLAAEVSILTRPSRPLPGVAPGPVTFFAPPKKVTKERGSPVRRHDLVNSCGVPVLLDQPGGLRNSCEAIELVTIRAGDICDMANVFETRPVLARNPGLVCAARRRTGAPKSKLAVTNQYTRNRYYKYLLSFFFLLCQETE